MIRYHRSPNIKRCHPFVRRFPVRDQEKSEILGPGGSMVARLKLKGIDGRAPPGVELAA
jgi:hypothetical protein